MMRSSFLKLVSWASRLINYLLSNWVFHLLGRSRLRTPRLLLRRNFKKKLINGVDWLFPKVVDLLLSLPCYFFSLLKSLKGSISRVEKANS